MADRNLKEAAFHRIEGMQEFRYEENIEGLTRPSPEWPKPTDDLSGIRIALAVLEGILKGEPRINRTYYPGDIPAELPTAEYWTTNRFKVLTFAPPDLSKAKEEGIPSVRLGDVLQFLIGDKL